MEANPVLLFDGAIPPTLIREHFITKRGHFSDCEARVDAREGVGGKQMTVAEPAAGGVDVCVILIAKPKEGGRQPRRPQAHWCSCCSAEAGIFGLDLGNFPGRHQRVFLDFYPAAAHDFQFFHCQLANLFVHIAHRGFLCVSGQDHSCQP
jgi:hypothetical protein